MPTTDDLTDDGHSGGFAVLHPRNIGVWPAPGWTVTTKLFYPAQESEFTNG